MPERLEAQLIVETIDEGTYLDPETGEYVEPQEPEIDPEKFELYRDQIEERDVTPDDFGRIAAQTAKQVILQRIREAEREMMYEEYRDRVGELVTGHRPAVRLALHARAAARARRGAAAAQRAGRRRALRPRPAHQGRHQGGLALDQGPVDHPQPPRRRADQALFELEVPEIADGLVEIANVAREPGYRSKIAVVSYADGVDPVGACVGPRGSRVRMVVSELRGEKIDIIPYNDEPARFVAKALSPARVREVLVDDEQRQATVIVPDDQLSLAIGREGQNARLAARLTGWRIDIRSETEFATDAQDSSYEQEEPGRALRGDHVDRPPLPERGAARLGLLRPAGAPGAVALLRQLDAARPGAVRRGDRASSPIPTSRRRTSPTSSRSGEEAVTPPQAAEAAGRTGGAPPRRTADERPRRAEGAVEADRTDGRGGRGSTEPPHSGAGHTRRSGAASAAGGAAAQSG